VVAHWRAEPDALAPLRGNGIVREAWLNELLSGAGTAPGRYGRLPGQTFSWLRDSAKPTRVRAVGLAFVL
jgi:hypothetical protein